MLERYIDTEEFLDVPMSAHRYSIDINGTVKGRDSEIIEPTLDENGEKVLWLPLWDGWRSYKVAEILLFTFKPTNVPISYWNRLSVMFADGNPKNIHPANLVWKHPIGLVSKRYPNHAFIPCFTKYVISKEGEVINFLKGNVIAPTIRHNGYVSLGIASDIRTKHQQAFKPKRHRLVALAWLDYPRNAEELVVNHIDSIPGNDSVSNLEWATYKENTTHAINMGRWRTKAILRDVFVFNATTGKIKKYQSIPSCAKSINLPRETIISRLNRSHTKIYPGHLQFSYTNDHDDWQVTSSEEQKALEEKWGAEVLIRNAKTGEIRIFNTISEASTFLNVTTEAITHLVYKNHQPILPGYFQVKKSTDYFTWREPDDLELEHAEAIHGTAVLARNVNTGEITEYVSAVECSKALGLCNEAVNMRFRYGAQKVFQDGLQFKRKADSTPWNFEIGKLETYAESTVPVPVRIRDIFTNEQWEFKSISDAQKTLNIPQSTLMDRKTKKENRPYLTYEIKYNGEPFYDFTEEELEMIKQAMSDNRSFRGRGYIVTDIATGEETLCHDRIRVSELFGGELNHISTQARGGGIFKRKYRIRYFYNKDRPCPFIQ